MIVYAEENAKEALRRATAPDRAATLTLAKTLFPAERLEELGDGDLSYTCPPEDEIHIGCFRGVSVVAAKEFGIDFPSQLSGHFIRAGGPGETYLHAMHSVVDWFALVTATPKFPPCAQLKIPPISTGGRDEREA